MGVSYFLKREFDEAAAKGYPVWAKTTMFDDNGQPSFSYVQEVLEFFKCLFQQLHRLRANRDRFLYSVAMKLFVRRVLGKDR